MGLSKAQLQRENISEWDAVQWMNKSIVLYFNL